MRQFLSFWANCFWRAAKNSWGHFGFTQSAIALVGAICVVGAIADFLAKQRVDMNYWLLVIPAILFVGLFIIRLITAPYEIHKEDQGTIKKLQYTLMDYEKPDVFALDTSKTGVKILSFDQGGRRGKIAFRFEFKNYGKAAAYDIEIMGALCFPEIESSTMSLGLDVATNDVVLPGMGFVAAKDIDVQTKGDIVFRFVVAYKIGTAQNSIEKRQSIWQKCDLGLLFGSPGQEEAALSSVSRETAAKVAPWLDTALVTPLSSLTPHKGDSQS